MPGVDAKNEAEEAKEREVALWQEALETGQKVHPLTEEILNKHAQGPIIIEDERNNSGNQEVSSTPPYETSLMCSRPPNSIMPWHG